MKPARPLALLVAISLACSGGADTARSSKGTSDSLPPAPAWTDALALTTADGVEVWFTAGRKATKADGTPCTERVMEIRRDGRRMAVPLLYTGDQPVIANDTSFYAHIWLNCEPGNLYQVSLRTGQPFYLGPKPKLPAPSRHR